MDEAQSAAHPEDRYIRGVGTVGADPARVLAVLAVLAVAGLVAVTAYLFVSTADRNSSASRLAAHGRPVEATVTGCAGISDGIGMGVVYYQCTASASLDGRTYAGVLHGDRADLPPGDSVAAVVVPGDASSLTVAAAVSGRSASYVPAVVMAGVTVVAGGLVALLYRRRRSSGAGMPHASMP